MSSVRDKIIANHWLGVNLHFAKTGEDPIKYRDEYDNTIIHLLIEYGTPEIIDKYLPG